MAGKKSTKIMTYHHIVYLIFFLYIQLVETVCIPLPHDTEQEEALPDAHELQDGQGWVLQGFNKVDLSFTLPCVPLQLYDELPKPQMIKKYLEYHSVGDFK